tara:strand:+ start:1218 stop:3137 length:1920 start_codon:yes stop_codon:yes gene_type:complete
MNEVISNSKYNKTINSFITPGEIILGFYGTEESLTAIKKGEVCTSNCKMIKVYSLEKLSNTKLTPSNLETFYEMSLKVFENDESIERVINKTEDMFENISFEKPVIIEKYNSNPNIKSAVLMSRFYNNDLKKSFTQIMITNYTLIDGKIILYAVYSLYDGLDSINDTKNESDYFGLRLLSENKRTLNKVDINSLGEYLSFKNHPKAKGVNIKIKKSEAFKKEEGDRPNIVTKFIHKKKQLYYLIQIINSRAFISRNTVKELFSSKEEVKKIAADFVSPIDVDANIISTKIVTIDNYQAIEVIYNYDKERMGKTIKFKNVSWLILYEDTLIHLNGAQSGKTENFDESYKEFFQITNSVLFEDQYNSIKNNFVGDYQDFEVYVDKFFRELQIFGILKIRPEVIDIKLMPLDAFKDTNHLHGFSRGVNNDEKIDIVINKRSWNTFNKAQKHYLIFHELAHDVLNLKDLNSNNVNENYLMYPSIDTYKDLSMDDFIDNLHVLLEEYKEPVVNNIKNATYYYNLGVSAADLGEKNKARVYFERSIELDPDYENSYGPLILIILNDESKIIEEMNSLSLSEADTSRYDILIKQREDLYKDCIPLLEKSNEINPNKLKIDLLIHMYGTLGDNVGYNKAKKMLANIK